MSDAKNMGDKAERLAAKLRENLRRRKEQAREAQQSNPEPVEKAQD